MPLTKAANSTRHPAAAIPAGVTEAEPKPQTETEPVARMAAGPARPAEPTRATRGQARQEGSRSEVAGQVLSLNRTVAPRDPAPQPPRVEPTRVDTVGTGDGAAFPRPKAAAPQRPAEVAQPAAVRRVKQSLRGKRDYNYSWPREDVRVMRAAYDAYKPVYRRYWKANDPEGQYRLVFSAFVAKALLVALEEPQSWLGTVRNDARKEPVIGGREQVGLVWPIEVEDRVVDLWETVDKSAFPEGFSLTKQHLAAAAILHGLRTVDQWVLAVGNDDRFSVPVDGDGRLRSTTATGAEQ